MTESDVTQDARDPYLHTNTEHEALGSLEAAARFVEAAETDSDMWKWAVIALHNAVQGFMVLALRGSESWGALRDDDIAMKVQAQGNFYRAMEAGDTVAAEAANQIMLFSPSKLAGFLDLYKRIKRDRWPMNQGMASVAYTKRITDDRCMEGLNRVRNEFAHFQPAGRLFLLSQFPAITATGLHIISFLVKDSGNIHLSGRHDRDDPELRFTTAMTQGKEALARIASKYAGLALPPVPHCGSSPVPAP
jgi:hypothetical protein